MQVGHYEFRPVNAMFSVTLISLAIAAIVLTVTRTAHGHPAPSSAVTNCSSQAPIAGMTCHNFWSEELGKNSDETNPQQTTVERSTSAILDDLHKTDGIPNVTPINPSDKGSYHGPHVIIPKNTPQEIGEGEPWLWYSSDAHHEMCQKNSAELHFEHTTVAPDEAHCGYLIAFLYAYAGHWWINPQVAEAGWHTTLIFVDTPTGSCSVMMGFDFELGQSIPPTSLGGMDIGDTDVQHWLDLAINRAPSAPIGGPHQPVHARGIANCLIHNSVNPVAFQHMKWAVTVHNDWGIVSTPFGDKSANTPRDLQTRQSTIPRANATLDYKYSPDPSGQNYTQCRNDQAKAIPLIGTPYLDNCRIIQDYLRSHGGSFKVVGKDLASGSKHQLVHADSPRGSCTIIVGNNDSSPTVAADAEILIGNEDVIRWLGTGITLISDRDGPGYAKGTSECINGKAFHTYAGLHWAMTRTVEVFGWDDMTISAVDDDDQSVNEQESVQPSKFPHHKNAIQGAIPRRNRAARKNDV